MERVICKNGHFYDGDRFQECPHCAAGMEAVKPSSFAVVRETQPQDEKLNEKTSEKRKLFGHRKSRQTQTQGTGDMIMTEDRTQILPVNMQESAGGSVSRQNMAQSLQQNDGRAGQGNIIPGRQISGAQDRAMLEAAQRATDRMVESESSSAYVAAGDDVTQKLDAAYLAGAGIRSEMTSAENADRISERPPEINEVRYISTGSTSRSAEKSDGRTIGFFSAGKDTEPPVGYLICTEGEDYGMGFPLKSGNNSLGRSSSMDVVVMDLKVSREKQAFVMYEPHKREFFLKPGDGAGLCYLNDEVVLEPKKLKAYDLILLGDTKLMLIPVCGEQFSW